MKTAIYIEDGVVQLVLTPQNKFEKDAVKSFKGKELLVQVFNGSFYDCRGGWITQDNNFQTYNSQNRDSSIILRINDAKEEVPPQKQ